MYITKIGQGKWIGGKPPFGYRYDKSTRTFRQDALEIGIVKEIFGNYKRGEGFKSIAEKLKGRGGRKWDKERVRCIVTNPFYAGYLRISKVKRSSHATVLDDRELWEMSECTAIPAIMTLQEWENHWNMYTGKRSGEVHGKHFKTPFWLKGIAYCAICNKQLKTKNQRTKSSTGKIYGGHIYQCPGCKMRATGKIDLVVMADVLNVVLQERPFAIVDERMFYQGPKTLHSEVLSSFDEDIGRLNQEVQGLEKDLGDLEVRIHRAEERLRVLMNNDYEKNRPMIETVHEYRMHLRERVKECKTDIDAIQEQIMVIHKVQSSSKLWDDIFLDSVISGRDPTGTAWRRLAVYLLKRVDINPNDEIVQIFARVNLKERLDELVERQDKDYEMEERILEYLAARENDESES